MKMNNFDGIAFLYDALARVFFGSSLRKAQTYFTKNIPEDARVLILGSGTGWIAEKILDHKPNSKITLVDASQKMTALAAKRLKGKPIEIICADQTNVFPKQFDIVILPCFLDLFPDQKLFNVIDSIKVNLKPHSLWIVTDFICEKRWHRVYLWIMYRFFKWTCNIEADQLPNWRNVLSMKNLEVLKEKNFYQGFIKTILYKQT